MFGIFQDLQDIQNVGPLKSNLNTLKNASGKRYPCEKHNRHRAESEILTKLNQTQLNKKSTKMFQIRSHVCSFLFRIWLIVCNCCPKFNKFDEKFSGINLASNLVLLRSSTSPRFSKCPAISQNKLLQIFQQMLVEKCLKAVRLQI